nr:MAG TPA: hypothetical protein [Bacteriophage sp.]
MLFKGCCDTRFRSIIAAFLYVRKNKKNYKKTYIKELQS